MEPRKITVVETKRQRKSVIMSAATTLEELKRDFRANNIDYDGMSFYEGLSKTELKADSSLLPHDINYKGQITNELIFMLTNTNKKIKSGSMTRAEAYNDIKSMGLQDACIKKFGKNFTQCSTAALISLIENSTDKPSTSKETAHKKEEAPTVVKTAKDKKSIQEFADIKLRKAVQELVRILYDNDTLDSYEEDRVLEILEDTDSSVDSQNKIDSPYSDDDIDNIFLGMNID